MPDGAVVALDVGVLLGLAGLDVLEGDAAFHSPFHQLFTDVFRAVVDTYGAGLAAPLDDPIKALDHSFGWERKIHFDAQPFAIEVVQHVQQPECPAIHCPAVHVYMHERGPAGRP